MTTGSPEFVKIKMMSDIKTTVTDKIGPSPDPNGGIACGKIVVYLDTLKPSPLTYRNPKSQGST